jgi:hypothetical protein
VAGLRLFMREEISRRTHSRDQDGEELILICRPQTASRATEKACPEDVAVGPSLGSAME